MGPWPLVPCFTPSHQADVNRVGSGQRCSAQNFRFEVYGQSYPRSPGTHIVGPWAIDSINSYRDLRTGTQYIGNWASRVKVKTHDFSCVPFKIHFRVPPGKARPLETNSQGWS